MKRIFCLIGFGAVVCHIDLSLRNCRINRGKRDSFSSLRQVDAGAEYLELNGSPDFAYYFVPELQQSSRSNSQFTALRF
jgi:hypothetical protein